MAQGARVRLVHSAQLAWCDSEQVDLSHYIETGDLGGSSAQVLPYSAATLEALSRRM